MKKEIRLNAFAMNCVAHQSPGLWTHPRDRTAEYNRLPYWIDLQTHQANCNPRDGSIPRLPYGASQLHREPVVSLGSEMNMVSL